MTDALQLDMFKRVRRAPRQMMAYRDRGWNVRNEEICQFECPKCGTKSWLRWKHIDAADGPECPKCNKERA